MSFLCAALRRPLSAAMLVMLGLPSLALAQDEAAADAAPTPAVNVVAAPASDSAEAADLPTSADPEAPSAELLAVPPTNGWRGGPSVVPGSELESMSGPLIRMVLSLVAVLAVLAVCAWLAKRVRGGQIKGGLIQIVSGLSLGPKEKVVLLRVGEEEILVGLSAAGMQPLHVLCKPVSPQAFSLSMGTPSASSSDPASTVRKEPTV